MSSTNILINALEKRSATQVFSNIRISESDISTIEKTFNLTATSYGLQPIRLVILRNEQAVRYNLSKYCYGQMQPEQASHVLVICTEEINEEFINEHINLLQSKNNTPLDHLTKTKNRLMELFVTRENRQNFNAQFATNQAYIALGNLITALAVLGIDACPMEGFSIIQLSNALKLHEHKLRPVVLLPIGYKHHADTASKRKKVRRPMYKSILHL